MNIFPISTKVGRKIQCAGQAHLHFSGTAYLGMGTLPEFENMVVEGIHQYGPNYGASRGNNVRLTVYEEMESFFAEKAEAENALVMSSGFLAGYLTAAVLSDMAGEIWVAPDTHPAILPQGIKRDNFTGFGQFAERCVEESHRFSGRTVAIFANALDPLTPAIHSYNWVRELSQKNTYYLLLDDSHAYIWSSPVRWARPWAFRQAWSWVPPLLWKKLLPTLFLSEPLPPLRVPAKRFWRRKDYMKPSNGRFKKTWLFSFPAFRVFRVYGIWIIFP